MAVVAAVVHGGMVTTVGLAGLELEILVWSWRDLFFRDLGFIAKNGKIK